MELGRAIGAYQTPSVMQARASKGSSSLPILSRLPAAIAQCLDACGAIDRLKSAHYESRLGDLRVVPFLDLMSIRD